MFSTGDKVVSDKYGTGVVTGDSVKREGVKVDFHHGPTDCIYHRISGKRIPICGYDVITKEEAEE